MSDERKLQLHYISLLHFQTNKLNVWAGRETYGIRDKPCSQKLHITYLIYATKTQESW